MTSVAKQTGRLEMRDLITLTVLICLLFTFMLGNRPLSVPDEGRYVEIPREMVASGNYLTPRLNGVKYFEKPVLFYWLEAFSIKLFGLNEFTLRLWPALFALFGCLAVAVAGARLFGRRTGLLSAVVLATSLLYYGLSRAIILDMPVSILLTLALLSFLMGTHEVAGSEAPALLMGFRCLCRAGGPDQGPDRHSHPRHGDRRLDRPSGRMAHAQDAVSSLGPCPVPAHRSAVAHHGGHGQPRVLSVLFHP